MPVDLVRYSDMSKLLNETSAEVNFKVSFYKQGILGKNLQIYYLHSSSQRIY
jgi:hypothetical protein